MKSNEANLTSSSCSTFNFMQIRLARAELISLEMDEFIMD